MTFFFSLTVSQTAILLSVQKDGKHMKRKKRRRRKKMMMIEKKKKKKQQQGYVNAN